SSFMTFTRSSNTNGGFTVGIDLGEAAKAKFGAKGNVTLTYDQIFYSLQGIIDYLIANGGSLPLSKQLDGVISDKKNLQEKEKEIQKLTKAFVSQIMTQRIIPTNVVVRLTDITKSTSTIQANEVALSANVNAAIAGGGAGADLAFEVLKSKKLYVKSFPVLYLINNDCSINNDMSLGEVVKIVGEKFYNTKIYNKKEAVASDMKILLMDLISYVIVLDNLAKDDLSKSDRETLTIKKHNIEDHWLPPKTFGSYGRDGMLRSFMLMAIYLSHMNKDNKDYDIIRRKIYEQLCTLAKFMYLSKNEKGVRKAVGYGGHDTVTGCAEADITSGQFTLNMTLPFVGTSSVTLTKQTVKGSPFIQENGEFLVIKITLPISLNGTIITKILKIVCGELIKRAKKNSKLEEFTEISNMLLWNVGGIATRLISETLQQKSKIAKVIGIGMSASMDIKIAFYKSIIEDYSAIKPLPRKGNKVVKKGGAKSPEKKNVLKKKKMVKKISKWIPDYIAISNNKTFAMELSHSFAGASVGLKSNISRGETIKVSLSLHDILSKYNALSLGLGDDKTGKNAAVKFIEGKSNALCKILKPLGKENPDGNTLGEEPDGSTLSNVEIEMTKMYNEILSTPLTQKEKKDCDDKFIKFLTVCKELSKNDTPTEKTLSSSAATTNNPFAGISGGAANTSTEEVNDHTGEAPSEVSTAEGEEVTNTSAEEVNDHTGEAPSEVSTAEGEEVTNPSAEEVNDHIGEAAENNTEAPPYPIVINNILPILYLYHGGVFFQQYNGAFQISGQ
ncbi:MAG: hypothetical protein LBE95_03530, partial [Holosporaceae bacterium]|nr:hypothetical protein [Holosporaceae bacterium]